MSSAAFAGSNTANLSIGASVTANCSITTTAVSFGAYDPIVANATAPLNATGTVTVACTTGGVPAITLGAGLNASGATRRMLAGTANYATYELYKPPTTTPLAACNYTGAVIWNTTAGGTFTATAAPSKTARVYNVCGQMPAGQDTAVGTYADTVVATVNF